MKNLRIVLLILISICGSAFISAQTKSPAKAKFTSVYTDMKRGCKSLDDPAAEENGTDPLVHCKGYGGYRISMGFSAWGAGINVENIKNPDDSISLGMDYGGYGDKGEKIEWRMANGKPFAVIVRFGKYGEPSSDGNPFAKRTGSMLIIKGLKGFEQIDFEIDGAAANANQKAREMADANYSPK
jgi:hypothetical protein